MIWLFLAVATSVGFLGAVPFWDASGLPSLDDHWELVISGGIVGCLTLALLVIGEKLIRALCLALSRTRQRPGTTVVVLLIALGFVCLIAAVCLQWFGPSRSVGISPRASANASGVSARLTMRVGSSVMVPVTTVAMLIAGAILIGLGVWCSIPATREAAPAIEPVA